MMRFPRLIPVAVLAITVTISAACGGGAGTKLLVADNTAELTEATRIWAVTPGDSLEDSNLVAPAATGPVPILSRTESDNLEINQLALAWNNSLLTGVTTEGGASLSSGIGEDDQVTIATAQDAMLETRVSRRGVFTFTSEGCGLATDAEKSTEVGAGRCVVSNNDRWVVSWPAAGGDITIRDLRNGTTKQVAGEFVEAAVMDNSVILGVESQGGQRSTSLIDGETAEVTSSTDPQGFVAVMPVGSEADAFVLVNFIDQGASQSLTWLTADGETEVIAEGSGVDLRPISATSGLHYLSSPQDDRANSEVLYWSPDHEPTTIANGDIAALAPEPGELVIAQRSGNKMSFLRTEDHDRLAEEPLLELEITDPSGTAAVTQALVQGHTLHLLVGGDISSYVRLDLEGDGSTQPIHDYAGLRLNAIDTDGSALLSGATPGEQQLELLLVRAHHDEPEVRAKADSLGTSLIHEGRLYYTALTGPDLAIWSVRATGNSQPEVLYENKQLAGAGWPEMGGAAELFVFDPSLLNG